MTLAIIFSGFFISCIENPFFDNNKISSNDIRGTILLEDGTDPDGIYVWLSGFNLGTSTAEDGNFSLDYPPPEYQSGGGGINGNLNLYFYVANYELDSIAITFINGKIADGQTVIDNTGKLKDIYTLSLLVKVHTEIKPQIAKPDLFSDYNIDVSLQAPHNPITVEAHLIISGRVYPYPGFYILSTDNNLFLQLISFPLQKFTDFIITKTAEIWTVNYIINTSNYPPGAYKMVPFLIVNQPGIPPDLLASLGDSVSFFHSDYLNLPFKRSGGNFTIIGP